MILIKVFIFGPL